MKFLLLWPKLATRILLASKYSDLRSRSELNKSFSIFSMLHRETFNSSKLLKRQYGLLLGGKQFLSKDL